MVYHKSGIIEFASRLLKLGWKLLASGGTAKKLREEGGLEVTDIATLVGESIFGHRVVSLSREIYAGLLARDNPEDRAVLQQRGIPWTDLVCVDLYPLAAEIAKEGSTLESVIEQTDIGGPTALRAAAKGGRIAICDPADRESVLKMLESGQPFDGEFRKRLAAKVEFTIAKYCMESARYLSSGGYEGIFGERVRQLKYGENPWQTPAHQYAIESDDPLALHNFRLVEGNPSHTTMTDLDRSLQTLTHIAVVLDKRSYGVGSIAVGVKHGNACGQATTNSDRALALQQMLHGNLTAIFGGAIITNFPMAEAEAATLLHYESQKRRPIDVVAAPEFSDGAIEELSRKEGKCKLFVNPALRSATLDTLRRFRQVRGGFLVQPNYTFVLDLNASYVKKYGQATPEQELDMLLAWAIGSTSNSNKITLVKFRQLIGNGLSQQSRVEAAELAVLKVKYSGDIPQGASAYSDSFFPFPDGPKLLIDAGVSAILTTSGSIRDGETVTLCKERNVPLYMIPDELCRGFFGH